MIDLRRTKTMLNVAIIVKIAKDGFRYHLKKIYLFTINYLNRIS